MTTGSVSSVPLSNLVKEGQSDVSQQVNTALLKKSMDIEQGLVQQLMGTLDPQRGRIIDLFA